MTDLGIRRGIQSRAALWKSGSMTDLGTLGGTHSIAVAVNRIGQIAGGSYMAGDCTCHAVLWDSYIR